MTHAKTKAVRRMWADADGELALSKRSLLGPLHPVAVVDLSRVEELVEKAAAQICEWDGYSWESEKGADSGIAHGCKLRAMQLLTAILGPLPPQRGGRKEG